MRDLLGIDLEAALPRLKRMAARDPHPEVRQAARTTLDHIEAGRSARRPPDGAGHSLLRREAISLGDLVQALNDDGFDPGDEESFAAAAPLLRRLANNREFLAELAIEELKDRCSRQSLENRYSSQVIMLHRASEKFYIRANFWPSERDSLYKASGNSPFFYHVPHDHNFSFLTVGYLGPGYWSEYYEYDYESVVGLPGEKVDLKYIEKSRLEPGKVMLYRAHRDIHDQLPADDMSVSINIMEASNRLPFLSQYRFDVKKCEVAGILTAHRRPRPCSRSPPIMTAAMPAIWSKASPPTIPATASSSPRCASSPAAPDVDEGLEAASPAAPPRPIASSPR
jgi:hypothetical protein